MDENKRYLAKYSDLRNFAYSQIENLIRRQNNLTKANRNAGSSQSLNANSMNVYK